MRLITSSALGALTVWQEAEGEPFDTKVAVAEVIQRRARLRYDSDGTIAGTVARSFQFSAFNDDSKDNARLIRSLQLDDDDPVVRDCVRAWNRALAGPELVPNAVLFCRTGTPVSWAKPENLIAAIGNVSFYHD